MAGIRILFLGASRAVGLLGRFKAAGRSLGVDIEMLFSETDDPWHPIALAGLARLVPSPPFDAPGVEAFLAGVIGDQAVDIVIPCGDEAALAVARARAMLVASGALTICSSLEVCQAMADKREADLMFRSLGLRTPTGMTFPVLAKPRLGSGSRGIVMLPAPADLYAWLKRNRADQFVLQPYLSGREFSIDGYVDAGGRTLGLVSRERVTLAGGEVAVTRTERCAEGLEMVEQLLRWGTWHGPLTAQVIDDGRHVWMLECNPRLGSGVTCSIEAGLAVPEWILRERLGLPLPAAPIDWRTGLCMSRSWTDHFCSIP